MAISSEKFRPDHTRYLVESRLPRKWTGHCGKDNVCVGGNPNTNETMDDA